jgi:hypothetical protein
VFYFRILISIAIVVLAFLANNVESFSSMLAISAYSVRGAIDFGVAFPVLETFPLALLSGFQKTLFSAPLMSGSILLAVAIIAWHRNWPWLVRTTGAFILPSVLIASFISFPWQMLGLSPIRNAPYSMFVLGLLPVAALAGAKATDIVADFFSQHWTNHGQSISALIILAVAVVVLIQYKAHNFRAWLTTAGESMYMTINNLRDKSWMPAEPFRAISLRHKQMQPEPNIFTSFYGIAMLDAWVNLVLINHAAYWADGIHKDGSRNVDLGLDWRFLDTDGSLHYRIDKQASLPLLATTNVRYVFSPVPLRADGVRLVDGPSHPPLDKGLMKVIGKAARYSGSPWRLKFDRRRWQMARVFHYGKIYIYEIDGALPRVYAARGISIVPDDADSPSYFAVLEKLGPKRVAVVRSRDASSIVGSAATAEVKDFDLVVDGFDITVDAPEGGVIAINAARQPFFVAMVDDRPAPLVPVNGIQPAVPVPPEARQLKVRYRRPTVGERIANFLCDLIPGRAIAVCLGNRT